MQMLSILKTELQKFFNKLSENYNQQYPVGEFAYFQSFLRWVIQSTYSLITRIPLIYINWPSRKSMNENLITLLWLGPVQKTHFSYKPDIKYLKFSFKISLLLNCIYMLEILHPSSLCLRFFCSDYTIVGHNTPLFSRSITPFLRFPLSRNQRCPHLL